MPFEYLECTSNLSRMILKNSWYISSRMQLECEYGPPGPGCFAPDICQLRDIRVHSCGQPECVCHAKNTRVGHKNEPEYLKGTQNAVRIFRMHFEYPGM